jgi:hypothetical protein
MSGMDHLMQRLQSNAQVVGDGGGRDLRTMERRKLDDEGTGLRLSSFPVGFRRCHFTARSIKVFSMSRQNGTTFSNISYALEDIEKAWYYNKQETPR